MNAAAANGPYVAPPALKPLYSVAEMRAAARRVLPLPVFDFADGGAEDERTLRRNEQAFDDVTLLPRPLNGAAKRDLSITLFGSTLSMPLGIAVCALYGIVILFGLFIDRPGFALSAAGVATLLTTLAAAAKPASALEVHAITNRALTIVGIWVTAWLVSKYSSAGRALDRSVKDLADTNFALNQAAIVATTNVKGEMTFVNDKFVEISKYSREELLGRDHRIINSGYHSKDYIRDLWHTIANGRIWRGEIRNRAKDGSIYWVDTTIVPFLDEGRKPYQYMAIRYEITDRKRSEEKLREQAALARLGEMAAIVAHEVKNPLAAIKGALQIIGGDCRRPAATARLSATPSRVSTR